jgi:hypothetical protein
MSHFLGTVWFVALTGSITFIAGVMLADKVKAMLISK